MEANMPNIPSEIYTRMNDEIKAFEKISEKLDEQNRLLKHLIIEHSFQNALTDMNSNFITFEDSYSKITLRISDISSLNIHIDHEHPNEPKTDIIMRNKTQWVIKKPIKEIIDEITQLKENHIRECNDRLFKVSSAPHVVQIHTGEINQKSMDSFVEKTPFVKK